MRRDRQTQQAALAVIGDVGYCADLARGPTQTDPEHPACRTFGDQR
jgi:hypothetical protein